MTADSGSTYAVACYDGAVRGWQVRSGPSALSGSSLELLSALVVYDIRIAAADNQTLSALA